MKNSTIGSPSFPYATLVLVVACEISNLRVGVRISYVAFKLSRQKSRHYCEILVGGILIKRNKNKKKWGGLDKSANGCTGKPLTKKMLERAFKEIEKDSQHYVGMRG